MAEFILREHGIAVSGTPATAATCPAWMQVGFELYRKLGKLGFKKYPDAESTHKILETIANPGSTPLHTVAPWYFYWLQGLLKIADKMIAGVVLPGVLLVLLMAIPYLDPNPSRRGKDRRVAIVSNGS